MSFYKEVPGRQTTLESTLKFDIEPKVGSTNPVTSDGVKSAIDGAVCDASAALQEQIDEIAEKAGSGYIPKGEATVATLNALSGQENGELYTMTDAGTLTLGTLAVVAGDTVAWDATNEVWYKAMDYAPRQYGTNEVHNLPTTITDFRAGDYIVVDGTDTAKMGKDDLLRETAENAVGNTKTISIKSQTFLDVIIAKGRTVSVSITPSVSGWFSVALGNNDVYTQGGQTLYIDANTTHTFTYTATENYRQMRINNINNVNADVVIVNAYSVADSVFDASKVSSLFNSFAKEFDPLHSYVHGEFFTLNGQFYRTKKDFSGSQSNIQQVADPWMVSDIADLFKKNRVILDFPTYDYYVNSSGVIASVGNFAITDYLDITDATSITAGACFGNQYGAGVAFFDGGKTYLGSIYDDGEGGYSGTGDFMVRTISRADFPAGSQYIIVSGKLSYEHRNYVILDGVDTDILVHKVSEDTAASVFSNVKNYLKGMVVSFFGKLYTPKTYNYKTDFSSANFDEVKIGDLLERTFSECYKKITRFPFYNRFVVNNGNYLVEAGWCTTEYIDIEGVDALVALGNFGNQFGGGLSFYDKDFVFISNIHDKGDGTYGTNKLHILRAFTSSDFPAGAKYVRLTSVDSDATKDRFIAISSASIKGGEVAKKETLNLSRVCGWLSADKASITTNGTLEIKETPDAKNNVVVQGRAEFSTFGRLAIYRGNGAMRYGHIEIDDTNLYEYSVVTNNLSHTTPHGLTLGEYVNVTISVGQIANRKGNIVLLSGGGKFEKEIDWLGCAGNLTMKSVSGDYTNCKLRIGGDGYRMDTWVFADSYGDSWPWRLSALAPNAKFFIDAFSGRNSFDAYSSLISGLRIGFKPKRLVWALGMNDADSGAINADWKLAFDNVKLLCEQMDIEFIPCTIPCTPIRDNSYKDAYIKANAEQYIDVADCVGASVALSPWFTGLLGDDQIHPTEAGAFVIANEVIGNLGLVNG